MCTTKYNRKNYFANIISFDLIQKCHICFAPFKLIWLRKSYQFPELRWSRKNQLYVTRNAIKDNTLGCKIIPSFRKKNWSCWSILLTLVRREQMIQILRFYIFVYTPQSQQLPLRIARSVSDTILSHALGLDLKELGKVLLAAPKSRHVDDFNLTLRHDFQEWALMEEISESCAVRASSSSSPACTLVAEMCGLCDPLSIGFSVLSPATRKCWNWHHCLALSRTTATQKYGRRLPMHENSELLALVSQQPASFIIYMIYLSTWSKRYSKQEKLKSFCALFMTMES